MKNIYFCRHGLSKLNARGIWSGDIDTPLTPIGRDQAVQAAKTAAGLNIDYIISSPLSRAYDTAVIIADAIGYSSDDIEVNALTTERSFGVLEGTPWRTDLDIDSADIEGVESVDALTIRAQKALDHIEQLSALNILVVSHGSFGRAFRHVVDPSIPFNGAQRFDNAKVICLTTGITDKK